MPIVSDYLLRLPLYLHLQPIFPSKKGSKISDQFQENMILQKIVNSKFKLYLPMVNVSFWVFDPTYLFQSGFYEEIKIIGNFYYIHKYLNSLKSFDLQKSHVMCEILSLKKCDNLWLPSCTVLLSTYK